MPSNKKKIILDCDTGHDDAVAIMLAAKNPKIDLLAITVVAGNQTLDKTSVNTLNVCSSLDLNVPIAIGMSQPLVREQVIADIIHGESGLNGPVFGKPKYQFEKKHAVDLIIELLMESDGDITIVATGPLSNIAMAIRLEPRIIPKVERIVLMGGAYQVGNVTPAAEFNIYVDPEAAQIVFSCGRPVVMMGLDLTHQALCYPDIMARIASIGNKASKLFVDIMSYVAVTQKAVYEFGGPPMHDPTCVAWLIDESCVELRPMYTTIDLQSRLCYGRTVCDFYGVTKKTPNAMVGVKLDQAKFWDIVYDTLALYSE